MWSNKEITGKLDFNNKTTKNSALPKALLIQWKINHILTENIFNRHIRKGLTSKTHKWLLKLNDRKTNSSIKSGTKTLAATLLEKINRWQINTWKDVPHSMSLGKWKLKTWGTSTHLWGWPKSKHWPQQMLVRMWSSTDSYWWLMWIQKRCSHFRGQLVVSYKTKHIFIQSGYWTPWYLSKEFDNLCLYKYLHIGVYSSFIYNFQNFEPTKMWMDKENCSTSRQWNNFQC